jgi:hypothetical protein
VLPKGGYQFRRTGYDASAAFSIPSGAGDFNIRLNIFSSVRAPISNSLGNAFALNNQTPCLQPRGDSLLAPLLQRRPSALLQTIAKCEWVTL